MVCSYSKTIFLKCVCSISLKCVSGGRFSVKFTNGGLIVIPSLSHLYTTYFSILLFSLISLFFSLLRSPIFPFIISFPFPSLSELYTPHFIYFILLSLSLTFPLLLHFFFITSFMFSLFLFAFIHKSPLSHLYTIHIVFLLSPFTSLQFSLFIHFFIIYFITSFIFLLLHFLSLFLYYLFLSLLYLHHNYHYFYNDHFFHYNYLHLYIYHYVVLIQSL